MRAGFNLETMCIYAVTSGSWYPITVREILVQPQEVVLLMEVDHVRVFGKPHVQVKDCSVLKVIPSSYFWTRVGYWLILRCVRLRSSKKRTHEVDNKRPQNQWLCHCEERLHSCRLLLLLLTLGTNHLNNCEYLLGTAESLYYILTYRCCSSRWQGDIVVRHVVYVFLK